MKKSLTISAIIFGVIIMATGCKKMDVEPVKLDTYGSLTNKLEIVDLEFEGEKHEYVVVAYGLNHSVSSVAHWEGCKYCKEKK